MNIYFRNIILIVFIGVSTLCNAEATEYYANSKSQERTNKKSVLVVYMSLSEAFSDPEVRKLAQEIENENISEIDKIVESGVDVNSQGTEGVTLLFWALRSSKLQSFIKLLELGANPNIIFSESSTIHWAARHKDIRYLQAALQHEGNANLKAGKLNESPIFKTISVGDSYNKQALDTLLEAGADINAVTQGEITTGMDMSGFTPVMYAADILRYDIVYDLLERGANYKIKDSTGRSLVDRIKTHKKIISKGSQSERMLVKVMNWISERDNNLFK